MNDELAVLDDWIADRQRALHVPGVAVARCTARGVVQERAYGLRVRGGSEPVEIDSRFEAGSLAKPIVALTALQLAVQGALDLDAPIYGQLPAGAAPAFRAPRCPDRRIERVTARQLLSHTSGLPNWRPGGAFSNEPVALAADPGSRFEYSGEGYQYLQGAIEGITGRPLSETVAERVLEPLGLSASTPTWREDDAERACLGHPRQAGPEAIHRWDHALAAASLITTAGDLARFAFAVAADALPEPQPTPELRRAMIERPAVTIREHVGWGLGWGIERTSTGPCFFHHGVRSNGFECLVVGDPREPGALATLTNAEGGLALCLEIAQHIVGADHPGLHWMSER